jgi:hypothetical protein
MAKLSGPYEVLDLEDGQAVVITVLRIEANEVVVHSGNGDGVKVVTALRLHLTQSSFPGRLPYLDITNQRLKAMLEGKLKNIPLGGQMIKITKFGGAPKAVFSVEFM